MSKKVTDISRRLVITYAPTVVLGLVLSTFICRYDIYDWYKRTYPGEWDVLRRPGRVVERILKWKIKNSADVESSFSEYGPAIFVSDLQDKLNPNDQKQIKKRLEQILDQLQWQPTQVPSNPPPPVSEALDPQKWKQGVAELFHRLHVVPDLTRYNERTLNYCQTTQDYLKNHEDLKSIPFLELSWQNVLEGCNYGNNWQQSAFIGHSAFLVHYLKVSKNGKSVVTRLPWKKHVPDSIFIPAQKDFPGRWGIYISAFQPDNFLTTPLSYSIAASTQEQCLGIEAESDSSEAATIHRAFYHSVGCALAIELSRGLGIPRGEKLIEHYMVSLENRHPLLTEAHQLLRRRGVQDITKQFVEYPLGYRKALRWLNQ